MRAKDTLAGKRMRCVGCGKPLQVPDLEELDNSDSETAVRTPEPRRPSTEKTRTHSAAKRSRSRTHDEDEPRRHEDPPSFDDESPRRKKRRRNRPGQRALSGSFLWLLIGDAVAVIGVIVLIIFLTHGDDGNKPSAPISRKTPKNGLSPGPPKQMSPKTKMLIDELVALTKDSKGRKGMFRRIELTNELSRTKTGHFAVPALVKALQSDYIPQRTQAAKELRSLRRYATKAIPNLLEALKDKEYSVREAAIVALGWVCAGARTAGIPPLPKQISEVVRALIAHIPEGTGAPNDLNKIGLHAFQALGRIGPPAAEAVPHIIPTYSIRQFPNVAMLPPHLARSVRRTEQKRFPSCAN